MTSSRSSMLRVPALAVLACAACSRDSTFTEPVPPLAAIHWVNAVPDTNKMAFRLVDIVSNAGLYGATFRSANMFYQGIEAGARHIRVFFDTTDVTLAQTVFSDTTFAFTADQSYTFIEAGFARGGPPARAVWIIADNAPDPGAGKVGVRVIHAGAGAGIGNVDVWLLRRDTTTTLTATSAAATNVPYDNVLPYGVVAPDTAELATPVNAVFTTAATGGTLAAGTYWYRVSATNRQGETLASAETSITTTGSTSTVTVNWGAVTGATGYKVYGRKQKSELFMIALGNVLTWTDDGTITPAGALPTVNTTATDSLRIVATATGTTTPILVDAVFPVGVAGDATTNPIAGARVAQSVMTAILVPASVAGSRAPQGGAFAAPSAVILVDRRPPNTVP